MKILFLPRPASQFSLVNRPINEIPVVPYVKLIKVENATGWQASKKNNIAQNELG